jgi:hypothetical protein
MSSDARYSPGPPRHLRVGRHAIAYSDEAGRVEDWGGVPKVKSDLLLPVAIGSALGPKSYVA